MRLDKIGLYEMDINGLIHEQFISSAGSRHFLYLQLIIVVVSPPPFKGIN